jgi:exopolyphosphatase/guanosine-5'-triphosphate,3'-diphosphate pyrophosphatase
MRIAAIDVGTNSIHMIVCRIRPDLSFEVIDREKDMIRLGAGGLEGGPLGDTSIAVAMQTLAKFRRLAESHAVDEITAAATSAVREASNGAEFIAAVRRDVGIRVRVISGIEEARLIHQAALYATGAGPRRAVVIDIGGGSTEITLGTPARMQLGRSFKLGAIRLTERFAKSDPLTGRDERRLVRGIRRETAPFLRQLARRGFERVIGTSGTILALGAVAAGRGPQRGSRAGDPGRRAPADIRNLRVSARDVHRVRKLLVGRSLKERLATPGLDPRRADLAVAGAILLDTLLESLGVDEITLCDFALREGLVLDYIQKNQAHIRKVDRYPDVRRRSIVELAERCNYWAEHAQQVTRLALALFDGTRELHALGDREREWLEYGALLHDIGVHISYERHHKHSYYLIRHGGLRGFEPLEIEVIGLVARYHRQSLPKKSHEGFDVLPRKERQAVRLLAAFLRLAEGLDRSHGQVITDLEVRRDEGGLAVRLRGSADPELELWAAGRHAAPLAALLGVEIRFEAVTAAGVDTHAEHARDPSRASRPAVRRRGHRRLRQDHAARPAREVARRERAPRLRH